MLAFGCKNQEEDVKQTGKMLFINMYKYVICTVSHWTSIQCWTIADTYIWRLCVCLCAMYWDVSKSQYAIAAVVKQVRKAIDYKLTNKHERNNIESCIRNWVDRTTIRSVYNFVRFYIEQQSFIPITTTAEKFRFCHQNSVTVNRECQMLCCTKCEKNMCRVSDLIQRKSNNVFHFAKFCKFLPFAFAFALVFIHSFILCESFSHPQRDCDTSTSLSISSFL